MTISIELCSDPELLQDYFRLRERCYRQDLQLSDFSGDREVADQFGQILLAHDGRQCVGGARIVPASTMAWGLPRSEILLGKSCAWERAILDPGARSLALAREFCAKLVSESYKMGYKQALVLSSLRNARYYRRCHNALGVDFRIARALPVPQRGPFRDLEHYLSISSFRSEPTIAKLVA